MLARSLKVVVLDNEERVLLLRNDRDEWELPGGRPEHGESDARCVVREAWEETGLDVMVGPALDRWDFEVVPGRVVEITAYGGWGQGFERVRTSPEHLDLGRFTRRDLDRLVLPVGYRDAIECWRVHRDR